MSRIAEVCSKAREQGRKLLIPYLVAGDPNLDTSLAMMHELVRSGADIIELGIPFSDPSSDGPVIQRGVERALAGHTSLTDTIELLRRFREQDETTPVVLMGYLNPIEIMGYAAFVDAASSAGVDGVLTVDMPPNESTLLHGALCEAGIDTIYLVAPTTSESRVRDIIQHCSGYLYYVSLKGVTGAALTDHQEVADKIAWLRALTDLPMVIGFGIKDAASASAMGAVADGVVIGSALVSQMEELPADAVAEPERLQAIGALFRSSRDALDGLAQRP